MAIRQRPNSKMKNGIVYEVYFRYQENGQTKRFQKSGFKTKKEAKEFEARILAEIQNKGGLQKEVKKTFEDVYNEFLEIGSDHLQYNTVVNTKNVFKMYLRESIASYQITSFDYATLQRYFNSIADGGLERNKNIRKAIKRVLDFALKMKYIESNPIGLVTVKGVSISINQERVLSLDDLNYIINELEESKTFKNGAYSMALQIALYTGLRISEVLALDKSDFDFENNRISVNKKLNYQGLKKEEFFVSDKLKSKSSKAQIPLIDKLKDVLIEWFKMNPYSKAVCDVNGLYINPNTLSNDVKKIAKKRNIYFHFHMLRHTFATILVTNRVDVKVAQELMRHNDFNTTLSLYTHINNDMKLNTLNSVFK